MLGIVAFEVENVLLHAHRAKKEMWEGAHPQMPIDGERFQRRSPFLFIGLFNHDAHHAPWFFFPII